MSTPRQYRRTRTDRSSHLGEASRERVLCVALEQFAEHGYRGTAIADVAKSSGLSQSGLLHHFPSKVALLIAALEYREVIGARSTLPRESGPPMGWSAFDSMVAIAQVNSNSPKLVRLFVTMSAEAVQVDHPAHCWLLKHHRTVGGWLRDAVRAGKRDGEISADAPEDAMARAMIAFMDGLQIQWLASGEGFNMTDDVAQFVAELKARWATGAYAASLTSR